jgi:outer membrane protein
MTALVASVVCLSLWCSAWAQGDSRAGSVAGFEGRIALVDIAYIFKNYDKFTRLSEQMKEDVQIREKEIQQAQSELKTLMARRATFKPDSPDFKSLDEQIARRKAELELMADGARREFTQREAALYHQTYQEIELVIKRFAEDRNLSLVLRSSRDEAVSPSNPQDVIKEVSQQVLYAQPQMDITDTILAMLNRSSGTPSVPTQTNKSKAPASQPLKTGQQPPKAGNLKR